MIFKELSLGNPSEWFQRLVYCIRRDMSDMTITKSHTPDLVQAFSNVENGGLNLVL